MTALPNELDRWLSPQIRAEIEALYYAEVNSQARFDVLSQDPTFLETVRAGGTHAGLFADHGVVHVRDVAQQVLTVLDRIRGCLIPERPAWRLNLMKGYGVLLAYFHDIGMFDFSAYGRAMHPEFAIHTLFNPQLDDIVDALWQENSANLAWRLTQLENRAALDQPAQLVLRELLALCMAHSKSKVPIDVLNDRQELRQVLIETISTDLRLLFGVQRVKLARQRLIQARRQNDGDAIARWEATLQAAEAALLANQASISPGELNLDRYYRRPGDEAFRWLVSEHPDVANLAEDALDTVRALRCADALRQRGTALKTSAGYEIFVSSQTGFAVYSLQTGHGGLYLLEYPDTIAAGEANLASSELDAECDLRISFHRGAFDSAAAVDFAVEAAARVVDDIVQDTITSFQRSPDEPPNPGIKGMDEVRLLLEETDDSAGFTAAVRDRVEVLNPWLRGRIRLVPSLRDTSEMERERYLAAPPLNWDAATRRDLIEHVRRSGQRTDHIDLETAFSDARLIELHPGNLLIEAKAPSAFVYIPMDLGLQIVPLGGYEAFPARAWTPLGATGVIRGAPRNATIVAEKNVRLLMLPKGAYLRQWNRMHTPESLVTALQALPVGGTATLLSPLEKSQLLGHVSLFREVTHDLLLELAAVAQESLLPVGTVVFEKGALGDSLYLIAEGTVLVVDEEQLLDRLGPGESFGEMAVLTPEPRAATIIVETEARLLQLPASAFVAFLRDHSEVAQAVMASLARRLRERSAEVVALRARLEAALAAKAA